MTALYVVGACAGTCSWREMLSEVLRDTWSASARIWWRQVDYMSARGRSEFILTPSSI